MLCLRLVSLSTVAAAGTLMAYEALGQPRDDWEVLTPSPRFADTVPRAHTEKWEESV